MTEPGLERHNNWRHEILREARVALHGRVVTLWRMSDQGRAIPELSSVPDPPERATKLDLDATLLRWGVPIRPGSRWVGCRVSDTHWCVAPVRTQPPAPPPGGIERRGRERITLELAGLCLGLLDRLAEGATRVPETAPARDEPSRAAGLIAHEVASPLQAALAFVDITAQHLREARELPPVLRAELLADLVAASDALQQAVTYLRSVQDIARGKPARAERFNVADVARSCVHLERTVLKKRAIDLDLDATVHDVYLNGDPSALHQVLRNLIRNAADAYGGQKGTVKVGLEHAGPTLHLRVHDRGVGIPAEHLEKVFEPGFTTKPFGQGTGAGLTVARDIAQTMFGGTVTLQSAPGEGTVATVSLPIPAQRT